MSSMSDSVTFLGNFTTGGAGGTAGVAFDGANIWVANTGGNTVAKLRASDGAYVSSFIAPSGPFGVAFDGANVWVTSIGSNSVSKY